MASSIPLPGPVSVAWQRTHDIGLSVLDALPLLLIGALVYAAFWVAGALARASVQQVVQRTGQPEHVARIFGRLARWAVLTLGLLSAHLPPLALVLWLTLAQGVAHGFAVRRYLVTAVAATTLGLLQAHMLNVGDSTAFALLERIADTLIGTAIAWGFAYVLPSWERTQLPALVARTLTAQAQHAQEALALGQLQAVDNSPELAWRLARREAYDSLSALVQATQRSLVEPRAVRPPLAPLERLQARSYQLLAQLTAVKTLLLLRRGLLQPAQVQVPLEQAAAQINALLLGGAGGAGGAGAKGAAANPDSEDSADSTSAAEVSGTAGISDPAERSRPPLAQPGTPVPTNPLPGPQDLDLSPWLLRRLALATELAMQVRADADAVLATLATAAVPTDPPTGTGPPAQKNQKR